MTTELSGMLRRILKSACEEYQASLTDLTVLSAQVDPYRIDTPAGHRDGQWLAEQLAKLYGPAERAHWRGLHYAIVAAGNIVKPDGDVYRNTDDDWQWLITAPAKAARWLGYVPFDRIRDQRNAAPISDYSGQMFALGLKSAIGRCWLARVGRTVDRRAGFFDAAGIPGVRSNPF